jgi:hypothetical protein
VDVSAVIGSAWDVSVAAALMPQFVQKLEFASSRDPQPVQNRAADCAVAGSLWRVPQEVQNNWPPDSELSHFKQVVAIGIYCFVMPPS